MNIANKIEYVAADEKRQTIPYIHVEDQQGRVTEYYAKDSTLTKDQIAKTPRHRTGFQPATFSPSRSRPGAAPFS